MVTLIFLRGLDKWYRDNQCMSMIIAPSALSIICCAWIQTSRLSTSIPILNTILFFAPCCRSGVLYDFYVAELPQVHWTSILGIQLNCLYAGSGPFKPGSPGQKTRLLTTTPTVLACCNVLTYWYYGLGLSCLMTPDLSKDIWCHVWPYVFFPNLRSPEQTSGHT